jgi:hypothetical protein
MRAIVLGAALALCACGKSSEQPRQVQPNAYDQQLQSLSVSARNLGLRNAIQDSGAKCGRVERSARQQDYRNSAMWVAHCTDIGDFALFVTSQGYAQIIRCDNLGEGVPACRLPADSPGG